MADRPSPKPAPAPPSDPTAFLLSKLVDTSWVSSQYDSQLFLNTVAGPGSDAAVLRLKHPTTGVDTGRGLAVTTDGNHRWCAQDAFEGSRRLVVESVLNLACVGARPIAMVNCLNFGNPEHPSVMRELSDSIDGMSEACAAFGVPVVGGNVSLYNESRGTNIDPTPVIGVLGLVDRLDRRPPGATLVDGDRIVLLGEGSSLQDASALADRVRTLVLDGVVHGVHDVADGGLALALAEMAARSAVGARISGIDVAAAFDEWLPRVVASVPAGVDVGPCIELGTAGGDRFVIEGVIDLALDDVVRTHRDTLSSIMGAGATH